MVTIKETAGKIILYFYQLQRVDPIGMGSRQLAFIGKKDGGLALTSDKKWLTSNLLDIGASSTDVYNAYTYLTDKNFIRSKERVSATARVYVEIQLTSGGIDIIEGVERGHAGKQDFYTAFNVQVESGHGVDQLVKENLHTIGVSS